MKLALVGATGLVGQKMLQVLEERAFPLDELLPVASERSVGKSINYHSKAIQVLSMKQALEKEPDVALFSAGGQTSLDWAPSFADKGCWVIDNSSAWRMNPDIPLVVPEINPHTIKSTDHIIANPNCSTIQMVAVLAPLHKVFKIKRVVVSTYQSVTGTGVKAVDQLAAEEIRGSKELRAKELGAGEQGAGMAYPHQIYRNCLPQCDVFTENDYTKEEMKLVNETRKILEDEGIMLTATAVRVPVVGGHSESVNVEFAVPFEVSEIRSILSEASGVVVLDDPARNIYPMPLNAHEKDEVFVGRIRRDHSQANTLNMWIVSDNLRKGAATNAIQIAEYLLQEKMV